MARSAAAAATWDRLARRYPAQERFETRAIDAALRLAATQPGERLVDLATGTGLLLRRLAAAGAGGMPREAIGVDRSPAMLARVGALPAGWSTLIADARAVPLPDGCADVVTCAYALQLLAPAARATLLGEAHRLLAPSAAARLVVVTPWADARLTRGLLAALARARPATLGGLRPLDPAGDLARAGFAVTDRYVVARGRYPSVVLAARPSRHDPPGEVRAHGPGG